MADLLRDELSHQVGSPLSPKEQAERLCGLRVS
jgi:hypothetical protein